MKQPDPSKARKIHIPLTSEREASDILQDMRKKRGYKEGFAPHERAVDITADHPYTRLPNRKRWCLPKHFCPLCKNNQVANMIGADNHVRRPSPGIWTAETSRPELHLLKDDACFYWLCPMCAEEWRNKEMIGLWTPRGMYYATEEQRDTAIREGVETWIKNAIMRGDKPLEGEL